MILPGLKYWRVIRYYFQHAYGVTYQELELFLFLYDERYFNRATFNKYAFLMRWNRAWFTELIDRGHIVESSKDLYTLSPSARAMMAKFHGILEGKVLIPHQDNPLFTPSGYTENKYRKMILRMNEEMSGGRPKIRRPRPPY